MRRTTGLLVAMVVALAGCADAQQGAAPSEAVDPVKEPPTTVPSDITCRGAEVTATLDVWSEMGFPTVEAAIAPWVDEDAGETSVTGSQGRERASVFVLRPDGTANMTIDVRRSSVGWLADTFRSCPEDAPGVQSGVQGDRAEVRLEVGHCYVEPLTFRGRVWGLTEEDQFGWGGLGPDGFVGTGAATQDGDVLRYVDESGAELTLVPNDDPGFFDTLGTICD